MIRFGYFGGATYLPTQPISWQEIVDHVNLGWVGTWACNPTTLMDWHVRSIKAGVALGIKEWVLGIDVLVYTQPAPKWTPLPNAEANLRAYFRALHDADLLQYVAAVYPVDEPNGSAAQADVTATNALVRRVLAEFVPAGTILLGVCYGGLEQPTWWQRFLTKWLHIGNWQDKAMPLVGLNDYDIIGADAYELGADILPQYDRLLPKLTPGQQIMLFPGGCSPWKQDPAPFVNWALAHRLRTFAVVPFTWFDRDRGDGAQEPGTGIHSNGMAETYRAIGKSLLDANAKLA